MAAASLGAGLPRERSDESVGQKPDGANCFVSGIFHWIGELMRRAALGCKCTSIGLMGCQSGDSQITALSGALS